MKKLLQIIGAALLCGALMFAFVGCGYEVEGQVPRGEKGSMLFFGVNYNRENSLSDGVKVEVNFAHEKVFDAETPYAIYSYVGSGSSYEVKSVYSLPLEFSTSESYNAKSVNREEFLPGMFAYSCSFPQKAVEITLPAELFAGESGSFSLVLAANNADFSDLNELNAYDFDYTVNGDTVNLDS